MLYLIVHKYVQKKQVAQCNFVLVLWKVCEVIGQNVMNEFVLQVTGCCVTTLSYCTLLFDSTAVL